MNPSLKALLFHLFSKKYVGGKHTLEKRLIKSRTKWISQQEKREFDKEYKEIRNQGLLLRDMKRTGKGLEWHISLNPRRLKELFEMLEENV